MGVADQFYRLKTHLSGIISALAIIRVLKYFMRRCLRFLKIAAALARGESIDTNINDAWSISKDINDSEKFVKENLKRQTNWPLILFLGVVLGGPYLIWKILTSIESLNKDDTLWMTGKIDHFIAVSEHDFDAVNVDELSFKRGQRIIIAPKGFINFMLKFLLIYLKSLINLLKNISQNYADGCWARLMEKPKV